MFAEGQWFNRSLGLTAAFAIGGVFRFFDSSNLWTKFAASSEERRSGFGQIVTRHL